MIVQTGIGLIVTMASAAALNYAYLVEHTAASKLPPLSVRRPLHSLKLLFRNRRWLFGFGTEAVAWGLYVLALALAPLALVQAVSAGGIGLLAVLVSRLTGVRLGARERIGVWIAIFGLGLLGISLAGGSAEGSHGAWLSVLLWTIASFLVAGFAIGPARPYLGGGAAFGVATGILFAAGDTVTKTVVSGGARVAFVPAMIACYALGTIVLQLGFQHGGALKTAGIATLFTNALPIAAGMTIYGEPLPDGIFAVVRVLSFAAVVAGAVTLSRPEKTSEGAPADAPAAAKTVLQTLG